MGEVYRARDTRLGRDVAIKVLRTSFANDAARRSRFEQEARATSTLNHPNVLSVFDVGTWEGSPYIVSELLEGMTLREHLRESDQARDALLLLLEAPVVDEPYFSSIEFWRGVARARDAVRAHSPSFRSSPLIRCLPV